MNIVEKFVAWCGSFAGILTILLIVITAGRMIMTAIREKKGAESTFYRNAKTLSSLFYAICILNGIAWFFHGLQSNALAASSQPVGVNSYGIMFTIVFYLAAWFVALKYDKHSVIWIAGTIAAFCFQQCAFHQMTEDMALIGFITIILNFICSCCIDSNITDKKYAAEAQARERKQAQRQQQQLQSEAQPDPEEVNFGNVDLGKSHKGLILTLLWIASVVAAYLAGEYSLIPKLVEFLQKHAEMMKEKKAGKKNADAEETYVLVPTQPES